ncbi:urease accessory protein UreD [Actinomyces gaoshouyii]|uniref:Urease accessory protein UreD n=1 Tax=Actinomyces gaoshouyii TaxID=1960083 RepID=A0A8H9LIC7_9ACTO|nr:urease accessory protein UreD [Actinomyces gaoshouyii]GGO96734.1 urease accessory protein UreD [Actinomyces gaoshouyii]
MSGSDRAWAVPPPSWPVEPTGELHLAVGSRGNRSVATRQHHRGALRVIRPMYLDDSSQVTYVMVNPGGGYLGGDTYFTDVVVDDGARLLLTTQAATKVYRTPGNRARQRTEAVLGEGAVLEIIPDQLIAYRGAAYEQTTHVTMAPSAILISLDVVTPGWAPDGSAFGYDSVRLRTRVDIAGSPVLLDNLRLEPADGDMRALGLLEGHSHVGSLTVIGQRTDDGIIERVRALLANVGAGVRAAVTRIEGPGMLVRVLGHDTGTITALLLGVDALVRREWLGASPLVLRKY